MSTDTRTFTHLDMEGRDWLVPYGMKPGNAGHCREKACRQLVLWVTTERGKPMPLNANGTSHFSTCVAADRFRREH